MLMQCIGYIKETIIKLVFFTFYQKTIKIHFVSRFPKSCWINLIKYVC